jgi:hypothetical protein
MPTELSDAELALYLSELESGAHLSINGQIGLIRDCQRLRAADPSPPDLRKLLEECAGRVQHGNFLRGGFTMSACKDGTCLRCRLDAALAAPTSVVHYAPYGPNAVGEFECGAKATGGGYTERPGNVTCEGCKAKSPGLWPKAAPAWTTAPASPGWYWFKGRTQAGAIIEYVFQDNNGDLSIWRDDGDCPPVCEHQGEWAGPIPEPKAVAT